MSSSSSKYYSDEFNALRASLNEYLSYEHTDAVSLRGSMASVSIATYITLPLLAMVYGVINGQIGCLDTATFYPSDMPNVEAICSAACNGNTCFTASTTEINSILGGISVQTVLIFATLLFFYRISGQGDHHVDSLIWTTILAVVILGSMVVLIVTGASVLHIDSGTNATSSTEQKIGVAGGVTIAAAILLLGYPFVQVIRMDLAIRKHRKEVGGSGIPKPAATGVGTGGRGMFAKIGGGSSY